MHRRSLLVLPFLHLALMAQVPSPPGPSDPLAALAAMPARAADRQGLEVAVIDQDGRPVADAIVVVIDAAVAGYNEIRTAAEASHPGDEPRILAARALHGVRHAVDERGTTRVTPVASGRVIAVRGDQVASVVCGSSGAVTPRSRRVELRLAPAATVRVAVTTSEGQPAADVPLTILDAPDGVGFPNGRTGADGAFVFRLLHRPPTAVVECRITAGVLPSAPLAGAGPDGVVLRLPPCGALRAAFGGDLAPGVAMDWVLLDAEGGRLASLRGGRDIVFPWVAVGVARTAQCGWNEQVLGSVPIPALAAGGSTDLVVPRDPAVRTLALQVLGPDGVPVPKAFLYTSWRHDAGSIGDWQQLGAEGWGELVIPGEAKESVKLRLEVRAGAWSDPLLGWAEIDLGAPAKGRTAHGPVTLQPAVVALRGAVVDVDGKPVAGVQLSTHVDSWVAATSGTDGVFELRMPEPVPDQLQLSLDGEAWFLADPTLPLQFAKGSTEARVVVRPAARVRFAARGLPAGVRSDFQCELRPAASDGPGIDVQCGFGADELRVPAGHWHFVIKLGDQEVHRLEDLRADAGVETHDPRFMDFDWRTFASLVTVRVEDRNGKPEDDCTVWHHYRNYGSGSPPRDGIMHILVDKEGGRISVEPEDKRFATIELGVVNGEHTVRIGGGPRLVVELSAVPKLPAGGELILMVGPSHEGVGFDAHGRAALWLPKAGEFALQLGVKVGDSTNVVSWDRKVEVGAAGETLKVELTPVLQKRIDDAGR